MNLFIISKFRNGEDPQATHHEELSQPYLIKFIVFVMILTVYLSSFAEISYFTTDFRENYSTELTAQWTPYISVPERSTPFEIDLYKPIGSNRIQFPVMILIHGDNFGPNSLSVLIKAYLRQDYLVVTLDLDGFSVYPTLIQLNEVLEYLLTRDDVNSSKIGVFGHSRGGLFAILFGIMRPDYINTVVSGNFDDWELYGGYARYMQSKPKDFSYVLNQKTPNNVLFILNKNDRRTEGNVSNFMIPLLNTTLFESNTLYGNFSTGTARQVIHHQSFFGHQSSLFSTTVIMDILNWSNQALDYRSNTDLDQGTFSTEISHYTQKLHFCFVIQILAAMLLSYLCISFIPLQIQWFPIIRKKIKALVFPDTPSINKQLLHDQHETITEYHDKVPMTQLAIQHTFCLDQIPAKSLKNKLGLMGGLLFGMALLIKIPIIHLPESFVLEKIIPLFRIRVGFWEIFYTVDSFFPFPFMWLWLIVFGSIIWIIIRRDNLVRFGKYTFQHNAQGVFYGIEIFLIIYGFILFPLKSIYGITGRQIILRNTMSSIFLLFMINFVIFEFLGRLIPEANGHYWKLVGLEFLIYFPLVFPEILHPTPIPEIYYLWIPFLVLNPWFYKQFQNVYLIVISNYLLSLVIFSLFHYENIYAWMEYRRF